ncbi:PilZ domain-containing protein [Clostridium sp. PL3]|uniref:PilZ domain-containing protein n=1 Tax=Clostridium thailandense TaxID=2794346 RepID=A0A949X402_9CLOT|nr:PilZ domain-containing protein [Clostridium thailandense]MBV7275584.1 PilZ domain-containing protein [Clostridium thailandense]
MENNNYSYLFKRYQIFKKEQRTNRRYMYNEIFKITSVNFKKNHLDILGVDISISGIGFVSTTKFEIDDILEIIFKYNKITIPATVKVVHVSLYDQGYFIGGQFIAIQNMYREILKLDLL